MAAHLAMVGLVTSRCVRIISRSELQHLGGILLYIGGAKQEIGSDDTQQEWFGL